MVLSHLPPIHSPHCSLALLHPASVGRKAASRVLTAPSPPTSPAHKSLARRPCFSASSGSKVTALDLLLHRILHYYRLIYHHRHFNCRSDRSDHVILPSSVGTIARPLGNETDSSDFYHRWVNVRCGSGVRVAFASSHEKPGRLGYAFCPSALN